MKTRPLYVLAVKVVLPPGSWMQGTDLPGSPAFFAFRADETELVCLTATDATALVAALLSGNAPTLAAWVKTKAPVPACPPAAVVLPVPGVDELALGVFLPPPLVRKTTAT